MISICLVTVGIKSIGSCLVHYFFTYQQFSCYLVRSAVQIKSHGQKLLYRAERGEDIFLGVCDSRAMECASDDEISSTQQVSESEDEFTGSRAHSMTNNREGKELCDFEAELATPKSFQNSTILYHVVMDKAPIKKPLGRLSLAKAFVHIQSRSRSPIAVLFNDSWPDTGSQNLDIMAATALLSLSSFSCVDQSPPDMSSRFSDFYHATKRVSNPHGDCEQIHKL